jgi:hypothetical protein
LITILIDLDKTFAELEISDGAEISVTGGRF